MPDIIHHDHPQRSPEWFAARQGVITASDAGAVLGMSRFRTPEDVRARKLRLTSFEPSAACDHGKLHEGEALEDLAEYMEIDIHPCGLFVRDGWLGGSPDGLVGSRGLVEIKCPYSKAKSGKPLRPISNEYFAQVQVQLHCTDRAYAFFWQWTPTQNRLEIVQRDEPWMERVLPILRKFWEDLNV